MKKVNVLEKPIVKSKDIYQIDLENMRYFCNKHFDPSKISIIKQQSTIFKAFNFKIETNIGLIEYFNNYYILLEIYTFQYDKQKWKEKEYRVVLIPLLKSTII